MTVNSLSVRPLYYLVWNGMECGEMRVRRLTADSNRKLFPSILDDQPKPIQFAFLKVYALFILPFMRALSPMLHIICPISINLVTIEYQNRFVFFNFKYNTLMVVSVTIAVATLKPISFLRIVL